MHNETHYQVLGVYPCATQDEIKSAYRALAISQHPDKGGDSDVFAEITYANSVLSDEGTRRGYDAYLRMTLKVCQSCAGDGCTNVLKNFVKVGVKRCKECNGRGYGLPATR